MTSALAQRIADALGWRLVDVQSCSLLALRELLPSRYRKLAHELTIIIRNGESLRAVDGGVLHRCSPDFETHGFTDEEE